MQPGLKAVCEQWAKDSKRVLERRKKSSLAIAATANDIYMRICVGAISSGLTITANGWGMGWQLESEPYIQQILMNRQMSEARVTTRTDQGTSVFAVKKLADKWKLDPSPIPEP